MYDQYELIATQYAETFAGEFDVRPFDRAIIRSFAELVTRSGGDHALDVGCGPGQAACELADCGLRVEGIDGSPAMVAIAQQRCPQVPFQVADMIELPYDDGSFAAVCAWYSIIHTPADSLPELFREFRRVLSDTGWLLLGFQTDAAPLTFDHAFGHDVAMTFLRHDVSTVRGALESAGFMHYATARRDRQESLSETADQAFVIAQCRSDHAG
ncbi:class I SAM-dependent methyltransferase [Mycobacterium sp. 21AC1]|uniref:class I SAM-dependent DNA methyltransferase n=1 Tax=[Mycobacterium] appelbergii TaxID=2939269 RepID=UPI00293915B6|nr:class I SAM-dependent methyltransferase [Mycobacterium sp. 21AC1]MDV3123683.1 class I SAM-dependent methyltransferase [Mycobacterium sp. 21AC1]